MLIELNFYNQLKSLVVKISTKLSLNFMNLFLYIRNYLNIGMTLYHLNTSKSRNFMELFIVENISNLSFQLKPSFLNDFLGNQ